MDNRAMFKLGYGLYVLSANENGKDNGCIVNSVLQVTNTPNRIAVAVNKLNLTHDMIVSTGKFALSVLTVESPFAVFTNFGFQSGRNADKFAAFEFERAENGVAYLPSHTNAFLTGSVVSKIDLGSHTMFIADVTDAQVLSDKESVTYSYYQSTIKPKPPKPTVKKGWRCKICGYVYEGDELPADFICPICKHGAQDFERIDSTGTDSPTPALVNKENNNLKGDITMKKFVCSVCGYVHEGDNPPESCPICKAPASKFVEQSGELAWADEHVIGVAQGVDAEIIEGLRQNFAGECTEVGMYLAMARAAHREGYPEIGLYWEKAAYEEAEHAAKFAELLGEMVSPSTKENLEVRVSAENGACEGKKMLAKKAKELGLDAIHDTVHEMARDEARHGKAFEGMLKRYFGK